MVIPQSHRLSDPTPNPKPNRSLLFGVLYFLFDLLSVCCRSRRVTEVTEQYRESKVSKKCIRYVDEMECHNVEQDGGDNDYGNDGGCGDFRDDDDCDDDDVVV